MFTKFGTVILVSISVLSFAIAPISAVLAESIPKQHSFVSVKARETARLKLTAKVKKSAIKNGNLRVTLVGRSVSSFSIFLANNSRESIQRDVRSKGRNTRTIDLMFEEFSSQLLISNLGEKRASVEVKIFAKKRRSPTPTATPTHPPQPSSSSTPTPSQTATTAPSPSATPDVVPTPTQTASPTPTNIPSPTLPPRSVGHPYTRFPYLEGRSLSDPAVSRFLTYVNGVRAGGSNYGFEPYFYVFAKLLTGNQSYCIDAVSATQPSVDLAMNDINAGRPPADLVYNSYLYAGGIIQNMMIVLDHCIGNMSQQQVSSWSRLAAETAYNLRVGFHDDAHYTKSNGTRVNANFSGWPFGNQANNYLYQHNRAFAYAGIVLQASHPQVYTWLTQERIATLSAYLELMYAKNASGHVVSGGGSFEGQDYGAFLVWTSHVAGLLRDSGVQVPSSISSWSQAQAQTLAHMMLPSTGDFLSHSLIGSGARDKWAGYEDLDLQNALETLRILPPDSQAAKVLRYVVKRSKTRYSTATNRSYYPYNCVNDLLYVDGPEQQPDLQWVSPGAGFISARSGWTGSASLLFAWVGGLWEESHLAGGDIRGHVELFANNSYQVDNGDRLTGGPTDIQSYHNVLRFPGRTQNDEPGSIAYTSLPAGVTQVVMNMTKCYNTPVNWIRTLTYKPASRELIVRDTWNSSLASTATASFAVANAAVLGGNAANINAGAARFEVVSGGTLSIGSISGGKLLNVSVTGGQAEFKVTW